MSEKIHTETGTEVDGPGEGPAAADESGGEAVLPGGVAEASTVLVIESMEADTDGICHAFYPEDRLGETSLLVVSLTRSAENRINAVGGSGRPFPRKLTVVSTEDRIGTTRTESGATGDSRNVAVRTVKDPSDLPKLGMSITEVLRKWPDDEILICFDSLTELLRSVELERVYRFVHVLTDRLVELDARMHIHVDAQACDDRTLATLRSLFDTVIKAPTDLESG